MNAIFCATTVLCYGNSLLIIKGLQSECVVESDFKVAITGDFWLCDDFYTSSIYTFFST